MGAWLIDRVLEGKRPNTRVAYLYDLDVFATWLGQRTRTAAVATLLASGDPQGVAQSWIDSLVDVRASTRKRRATTLRSLMIWASRYDLGPAIQLQVRASRSGPPPEELRDRLLAACGTNTQDWLATRDRAIIALASIGVGRGEMTRLRISDFDRTGSILSVGQRRIQLRADAALLLSAWIDVDKPEGALFHGRGRVDALTAQAVTDVLRRLTRTAGLGSVRLRDLEGAKER